MRFLDARSARSWIRTGLGAVLVLSLCGCNSQYTGEVSGTVKYQGKALPGGIITFIHPDSRTAFAPIQEDGSYSIPAAPGGDVKVTVVTMKPIPAPPTFLPVPGGRYGERKSETIYPAGKYVPIPGKYADQVSTPLKTTVNRGSQTFDIELVD